MIMKKKKKEEKWQEKIDRFKRKLKGIKKLTTEAMEHDICKLISDLNFEKVLVMEEIKERNRIKRTKNIKKTHSHWYNQKISF